MAISVPKTILLVDDEKDIRDVLEISLRDMGYHVHQAESGKKALALFRKKNPAIVLTDIKMPGMDGIEILRRIKRENPDTEVIMITGHGDTNLAIKSLKYEAVDFITKPISDDALQIALRRANEKIVTRLQLREYTENLEALVREKSELQDHLSSLGLMIGSISHGIKGLLTRLDGGVYLIDSALARQDYIETKEGLDILTLTIDRIKKMVLDILFYAKKRELKIDRVDSLKFANDIADAAEQKIKGHNIQVVRKFDQAPSEFSSDEDSLRSALINILENAAETCMENGSKDTHKIVIAVKQDEKHIIFEISDNGTGMDSEKLEKIFDLFYSSKGSKGTGFGLFISNNIIKQHGGSINVNSAKGKGSRFKIKIPNTLSETP